MRMPHDIFTDYYEDLQVSPNADKETIDRVYRLLARRWHPDNTSTGDPEKFNLITSAHKILSHPESRAAYDAGYLTRKEAQWRVVSEIHTPSADQDDIHIRFGILSILYASRRQDPENAAVGVWRLSNVLGWPENEMAFHVWYLKEKNWIQRTDTGGYAITAAGVEIVEEQKTTNKKQMLLTASTGQ